MSFGYKLKLHEISIKPIIILWSAIHLPNIKCSNVYRYRFYKGNYYAIYHYSKYGTRKLNKSSKKIRPFGGYK